MTQYTFRQINKSKGDTFWHRQRHGKKFFATVGSHVCSDDFFKAQALIVRDEEIAEKTKLKKTLQNKAELQEKGMAIMVEKAACFESNNYKDILTKELDMLLHWYDIPKEKMKKADKVAWWRERYVNTTVHLVFVYENFNPKTNSLLSSSMQ